MAKSPVNLLVSTLYLAGFTKSQYYNAAHVWSIPCSHSFSFDNVIGLSNAEGVRVVIERASLTVRVGIKGVPFLPMYGISYLRNFTSFPLQRTVDMILSADKESMLKLHEVRTVPCK